MLCGLGFRQYRFCLEVFCLLSDDSTRMLQVSASRSSFAFHRVTEQLPMLQSDEGGFPLADGKASSLSATSSAFLLASLYGLGDQLRPDAAIQFVHSTRNIDSGYGQQPGLPSEMQAVYQAVLSFQHLGVTVSEPAQLATYILSLYDQANGLFGARAGEAGDIRSTALALKVSSRVRAPQGYNRQVSDSVGKGG